MSRRRCAYPIPLRRPDPPRVELGAALRRGRTACCAEDSVAATEARPPRTGVTPVDRRVGVVGVSADARRGGQIPELRVRCVGRDRPSVASVEPVRPRPGRTPIGTDRATAPTTLVKPASTRVRRQRMAVAHDSPAVALPRGAGVGASDHRTRLDPGHDLPATTVAGSQAETAIACTYAAKGSADENQNSREGMRRKLVSSSQDSPPSADRNRRAGRVPANM